MTDAFGVVALVALTPLIAVQMMGIVYQYKLKKTEKVSVQEPVIQNFEDEILEFEEEYNDDKS